MNWMQACDCDRIKTANFNQEHRLIVNADTDVIKDELIIIPCCPECGIPFIPICRENISTTIG